MRVPFRVPEWRIFEIWEFIAVWSASNALHGFFKELSRGYTRAFGFGIHGLTLAELMPYLRVYVQADTVKG